MQPLAIILLLVLGVAQAAPMFLTPRQAPGKSKGHVEKMMETCKKMAAEAKEAEKQGQPKARFSPLIQTSAGTPFFCPPPEVE
jgi:hypothetical protein